MALGGILRALTPSKATLAGAGMAASDFIEEERKRGETMATKQFVAALQRAQASGDQNEVRNVLSDPTFNNVDPEVRQRAMSQLQDSVQAGQARELRLQGLEAHREQAHADTLLEADKLKAEGFNVEIANEDTGLPSGRPAIGTPRAGIRILGKGPNLKALEAAELANKEAQAALTAQNVKLREKQNEELQNELDEIDRRAENDARHLRSIARDRGALDFLRPETKERLMPHLVEMGVSLTKPRRMPQAFVKQIAEYNSAIEELKALDGTLKKFGGTHPVTGAWSWIPGTQEQKALAAINRSRQRIGKTLEGGVLRKEDEEKYKKILPHVFDANNIAQFKIDEMMATLIRDKEILMQTWQELGAGAGEDPELNALIEEKAALMGLYRPENF